MAPFWRELGYETSYQKRYFYAGSKRTNSTDYFINNLNSVMGVYDLLIFRAETYYSFYYVYSTWES